jgi:UDPglucose--hexose-1-phosphate uridylyltransferase
MDINLNINELLQYGLKSQIMNQADYTYNANVLIAMLNRHKFEPVEIEERPLEVILDDVATFAYHAHLISSNDVVIMDNFKAAVMDVLIDKPQTVINKFQTLQAKDPVSATDYLYDLSKKSNYIQTLRIAQNVSWKQTVDYGELEMTINLSKPEKDPKLIAMQKDVKSKTYPKCQLCVENEGFRGTGVYDARSNMRIIPITLNKEPWFFQYSPYSYFNEHSIVLHQEHKPMIIDRTTFVKLLDFLDLFPTYFVGSNAGLPIVGGSILDHEHFQSGKHHFPIEKAKEKLVCKKEEVSVYQLVWPLSTIRLRSANKTQIIDLANKILLNWQNYENKELNLCNSNGEPHHTITPISRKEGQDYVFDVILRSNYINEEYPGGVFHPHADCHHVKKENIGLIEAMGMGILPPRLKTEFNLITKVLLGSEELLKDLRLTKHLSWIAELKAKFPAGADPMEFVQREAGLVFSKALKDAGVFKMDPIGQKAFLDFIKKSTM